MNTRTLWFGLQIWIYRNILKYNLYKVKYTEKDNNYIIEYTFDFRSR